ncbi:EAL domain-containing protein [Rhodococcus sp. BP-160]|nr:EAL domain-containing protein [Rhodococcus sp. BP-288]MBY6696024.1 EAL domain-containing protein [Rhodococcus sp. BP-188]MBY6700621.1 EAL domain-containing protein [Rhodococcus sp. BP-285]MBY6705018.1 EAL domain-containing protein [Rhodococcus sp. BP-283]MBY6713746.1 EAL domain-containing protein [Rhodococcus sp. BP-160]MBY6730787.1 EAL domain-containing protein [Rhodococcus sp. BP-107]
MRRPAAHRSAHRTSAGDFPHPGRIHVDVLPVELDTAHLEASLRTVFGTGLLRHEELVLEIAENAIAPHNEDVRRGIAKMHALGVRVGLNDSTTSAAPTPACRPSLRSTSTSSNSHRYSSTRSIDCPGWPRSSAPRCS